MVGVSRGMVVVVVVVVGVKDSQSWQTHEFTDRDDYFVRCELQARCSTHGVCYGRRVGRLIRFARGRKAVRCFLYSRASTKQFR